MSSKLQIIIAIIFGAASVVIWFTFLRPTATKFVAGVILSKRFKPAGEYWQQPAGQRSGFYAPTRIPIAECYVFEIQVERWPAAAHTSLNTVAAREFDVGHRVNIEYQERGIPLLWKRIYVLNMSAVP
jgi:hypothetical protein